MPPPDLVVRSSTEVPAKTADPAHFTGTVTLEPLSVATQIPANVLRVSFVPGARTAWHSHPAGQILVVTSGNGTIATREWTRRMSVGDVVEIPANVEHWHGATPNTPMQHIAIQPDPGTAWLEQVEDGDFAAAPTR